MIMRAFIVLIKGFWLNAMQSPTQFLESLKRNGLAYTLREIIYFRRKLVVVEKDLSSFRVKENTLGELDNERIEINDDNFSKLGLKYALKDRYIKTLENLKKGYKSFAIVKGKNVIADIWYTSLMDSKQASVHPDLKWLSICLGEKDVYLWDVYADVEERKNLVAISLFRLIFQKLKQKGYLKAYGFIFCDNRPSMSLTKLLGFRELKTLKANRFFFYRNAIKGD